MNVFGENFSTPEKYSNGPNYSLYNAILCWLWNADRLEWKSQTKLQMQKGVYLIQILSPVYEIAESFVKFFSYNHGPYSKELQTAIHHLCCCGLVSLDLYEPWNKGRALYSITLKGKSAVIKLSDSLQFRRMLDLSRIISNLIDVYGIENIVRLVYEEPTFKRIKQSGTPNRVIPSEQDKNLTVKLVRELETISKELFHRNNLSVESLLLAYFDFLRAKMFNSESSN